VLNPHRSENRYRLYSDRDIAILRWLKNRVDSGIAISNAVNEMRAMAHNNIWPEAVPEAPSVIRRQANVSPEQYSRQLYDALLRHDEAVAGDLVRDIHNSYDITTICSRIYCPTLDEIGEAWYRGEIRVTTEHFASAYLRGKLLSIFQAYPTRRGAPYLMVGCAANEQHEMGALMLAVLLRSNGYRVEYLGPDIPLDDLVDYSRYEKPAMVILSATDASTGIELVRAKEKFGQLKSPPIFAYGGRAFDQSVEMRNKVVGEYLGDTLEMSVQRTRDLLKSRGK
jgi:methanogenic corrinoid protein MtbC1